MELTTTRRSFVKAAGTVASIAGLTTLAATSSPTAAMADEAQMSDAASASALTNEAVGWYKGASALNPNDPSDWRSNTIENFEDTMLFSGWDFGKIHLNHRMVKSSSGTLCMLTRPYFEEEAVKEVELLAKGGVEMIWYGEYTNSCPSFPRAQMFGRSLEEGFFAAQAAKAHEYGAHIGYQLSTMGMGFSGWPANALGDFECAKAHHLTVDEIHQLHSEWADAAEYLASQGFDAIELNCRGNNLGQAFLSRNRNERTDEYGAQTIENRTRFVKEAIQAIKERVDMPIQVLMNVIEADDKNVGNDAAYNSIEETIAIAKELEAAGVDALHLALGPANNHLAEFAGDIWFTGRGINGTTSFGSRFDFDRHWQGLVDGNHSGAGMMLEASRIVKQHVSVPVGAVTYMDPSNAPDFFERALQEGKCDFFLMTRPLYVEPDYVNKLREGRIDEIRPCTRCLHCHFDYTEDVVDGDMSGYFNHCRTNATTYWAYSDVMPEGPDLFPIEGEPKNVMVVGGGPAGMEAARVAALRGHNVTLYEKGGFLGGLLPFAHAIKGEHENLGRLNAYLQRQLEVTGVNVVLDTEVDADMVAAEAPDAVFVATGGIRPDVVAQGTEMTNVVRIDEVVGAQIGQEVVILGGNLQAVDMAMFLMEQGKHVTIVTPGAEGKLGSGHSAWVRAFEKPIIYALGTRVWPNAQFDSIGDGEVNIIADGGIAISIPCDTLVDCSDQIAEAPLAEQISGPEVTVLGDATTVPLRPHNIAEAIYTGNIAGRYV